MTSKNLVVGNWKMNLGVSSALELAAAVSSHASSLVSTDVWIAPSYTSIPALGNSLSGSSVCLGAQNVHWEQSGAFTGEISVPMLKELGCTFAIAGHSERRHVCDESNSLVAKRAKGGLDARFNIILCLGETLEEREASITHSVLEEQLKPVLDEIDSDSAAHLTIAYEPVWAIGTGKVATTKEIEDAHKCIHEYCAARLDVSPAILYGGSVTPDNFEEILTLSLVSGALVGGASLNADKFNALIDISEKCGATK